jgi:DNA-binding CsgD family transcriptional regulator
VNKQSDVVGIKTFGEPLPIELFYDGVHAHTASSLLNDSFFVYPIKRSLANEMTVVLVLLNRGSPVSESLVPQAKEQLRALDAHAIAGLLDVPERAAVEQRELRPLELWVFDSGMQRRYATIGKAGEPPLYLVNAIKRFCAAWHWDDVSRCASGAFSPVPNVLLQVTPLAGDDEVLAAVNVAHLKTRSLSAAMSEYALTEREGDVLKLLLAGFRANEIGDMLSIAESTVREHLKHALAKTGSRNRVQMTARILGYEPGVRHRLNSSFGIPN